MQKPIGDPHPNLPAASSYLAHSNLLGISNHVSPSSYSGIYQLPEKTSYVNNQSNLMYQGSTAFAFQERKGRINWRDISRLDVSKLIEGGDIKQLELLLSNLTFAKLEEEDFERFGDATLLKLFKLSQLATEYLMNTQNHLANQTQILDNTYKASQEKLKPFEEQAKNNSIEIKKLREEIRYKKKLISSYQNAVKAHKNTEAKKKHEEYAKRIAEEEEFERRRNLSRSPPAKDLLHEPEKDNGKIFQEMLEKYRKDEDSRMENVSIVLQQKLENILEENKKLQDKFVSLEKKINTSQVDPNSILFQQIKQQNIEAFEQTDDKQKAKYDIKDRYGGKVAELTNDVLQNDEHDKRHHEQMEHLKDGIGHLMQDKLAVQEEEIKRIELQRLKEQKEGFGVRYVKLRGFLQSGDLIEDVEDAPPKESIQKRLVETGQEHYARMVEEQERERVQKRLVDTSQPHYAKMLEDQERERVQQKLVNASQAHFAKMVGDQERERVQQKLVNDGQNHYARMVDVIEAEPQQKGEVVEDLGSENLQESAISRPRLNQTEYKDRNRQAAAEHREQFEDIPEELAELSVSQSFVQRYKEVNKDQKLRLLEEKYMEKEKKLFGMAENRYLKKYTAAEKQRATSQLRDKMGTYFNKKTGKDLSSLGNYSEKELSDILGKLKKETSAGQGRYSSIKTVAQKTAELVNSKQLSASGPAYTQGLGNTNQANQQRMAESNLKNPSNESSQTMGRSQNLAPERNRQAGSGSRQLPSSTTNEGGAVNRTSAQDIRSQEPQQRSVEANVVMSSNEGGRPVDRTQNSAPERNMQEGGAKPLPSPSQNENVAANRIPAQESKNQKSQQRSVEANAISSSNEGSRLIERPKNMSVEKSSIDNPSRRLPSTKNEDTKPPKELQESSNFYERDINEGRKLEVRESAAELTEKKQATPYFQAQPNETKPSTQPDVRSSDKGPETSVQRQTDLSIKEKIEEEKTIPEENAYYNKDPNAFKQITAQMIAKSKADQDQSRSTNVASNTNNIASSTKINQIADHFTREIVRSLEGPINTNTEKEIKQSVELQTKNTLRDQKQSYDENLVRKSVEAIVKRSLDERKEVSGEQKQQQQDPNRASTSLQQKSERTNIEEPLRGSVNSNSTPTIPSGTRNRGAGYRETSESIDFIKSTENPAFANKFVDKSVNLRGEGDSNTATNVVQRSVDQQTQKLSELK